MSPLFNKHSFLTLHNFYVSRSLVELIKVLKLHSPSPVYESIQFCPQTHHFRLLSPKCNLDISKNNYFVSSIILWNKCISKLLDNPDLLSLSYSSHCHNACPNQRPILRARAPSFLSSK